MTREQAMAFVAAALKSPKMRANIDATLGYGKAPEMGDFDSSGEHAAERCEDLIAYMEETTGVLREIQNTRARQMEIDLSGKLALVGKFFLSIDLEDFSMGPFDTMEAAISAAPERINGAQPGDSFFVLKAVELPFPNIFSVEKVRRILDQMADWVLEEKLIGLEDWPKVIQEPQEIALGFGLNALLKKALVEDGQWPVVHYMQVKQATIPEPERSLGPTEFKCVTCGDIADRADGQHDTDAGPECLPCYHARASEPAAGEKPAKRRRKQKQEA